MTPPRAPDWRQWPMLAGAVACIGSAVSLAENREAAAEALLVLGALLLGAWVVLLALHGHTGQADPPPAELDQGDTDAAP